MESKAIYEYIYFGTSLRYLQDSGEGWLVSGSESDEDVGYILGNLNHFLKTIGRLTLSVTKRAAERLQAFHDELATRPRGHRLTATEAKKLNTLMEELRLTLDAEASVHVAFIVTEKRLQVTKLLNDVGGLFAPGTFDALPGIAKYDLAEAGKCVAFERPTAAAFHLMRATEDVLRHFYRCVVRRDRVKPLLWGPMVISLNSRRKPPEGPLLANLNNIRVSFRNPTQHPEKIFDIHEVQDLFGLCIDVTNRMATSPHWKPVG